MAEIIDFPSENKNINLLSEIFGALDEVTETDTDGLELFAAMLTVSDEQFELLKPTLLDSFERTFNSTDAQLALLK